jgi:hypothetical protein
MSEEHVQLDNHFFIAFLLVAINLDNTHSYWICISWTIQDLKAILITVTIKENKNYVFHSFLQYWFGCGVMSNNKWFVIVIAAYLPEVDSKNTYILQTSKQKL